MGGVLSLKNQEEKKIDGYEKYHSNHGGDAEKRKAAYADMVNKYYDLATDFYEWGWGQSFHFAHQRKAEPYGQSIARHEHYIALRLGLNRGDKVLDVGCGVGGPLREIAQFSGAHVVGLNNNSYQIERGEYHNRRLGLKNCSYVKADFMHIPLPENSFDAVYQIEATCHAPDKVGVYKEIFRVLKPGRCFAGYDWCMTELFDPENPTHQKIKADIEIGNGLPDILTCLQCVAALKAAGFEVIDAFDMHTTSEIPWYDPLVPRLLTLRNIPSTWIGRTVTRNLVYVMELVGLAPRGSVRTQIVLETAADGLVHGGRLAVFTPMFFFLARKPIQ